MTKEEFKQKVKRASKKELQLAIGCGVAVVVLLVWWLTGFFM